MHKWRNRGLEFYAEAVTAQLEEAIISLFQEQDYKYVHGETIHRGFDEILLKDDLQAYLANHYPDLTAAETKKVISRLENIPSAPLYIGNRETFLLVNEGFDLVRDDPGKIALHINYINFEEPDKNVFKVVNQFSVQGDRLRRPDLLLFINGIPVAFLSSNPPSKKTRPSTMLGQITIRYAATSLN